MKVAFFLLLLLQSKNVIFFSYDEQSFSATGKWEPDPKPTNEVIPQETQIDCFKASHFCMEAIAEIYFGHPHVSVTYFDIMRWDTNGILATNEAACMTNTLQINFADKSIRRTDSQKTLPEKQRKACAFFGASGTVSYPFILKGSDRWEKEHWQSLRPAGK